MPGVLMLESLTQVAAMLLLEREGRLPNARVYLHGVDDAKFRRQVVPGDRLRLEVTLGRARTSLAQARALAFVGDQIVAEADLLLVVPTVVRIHPTAVVDAAPRSARARRSARTRHRGARPAREGAAASARRRWSTGWTEIGDGTEIFPFASIGLIPQDLKFKGERPTWGSASATSSASS